MAFAKGDSKQILVGAATFWIGDAAAEKPDYEAGVSYNETLSNSGDFRNAGFTQEGVEFSNEPEYTDVEVDQLLDSALTFKSGIRNAINTTFAEATLENLMVVWGQSDGTLTTSGSSKTLNIVSGELGEFPLERQIIVVGNAPRRNAAVAVYDERTYHFSRAISVEASSFAQRRNEATVLPVSFRLLPDDNGSYGTMHDRERTW